MSQIDDRSHLAKRRKLDTSQESESSPAITSHTQLRSLLVFQQNVVESKQGEHFPVKSRAIAEELIFVIQASGNSKNFLRQ